MNTEVETFVHQVREINEVDYEHFMKKVNHYLLDLMNEMNHYPYEDIRNKLQDMQGYIQFNPNWKVEPIIEKVIQDAQYIDNLLVAHHQDWES